MLERNWIRPVVMAVLLGIVGCGDDDSDGDGNGSGGEDAGNGGSTGGDSNGNGDACGPDPDNTMGSAQTGSIKGTIKASDKDKANAKGDLYIAVIKKADFDPTSACGGSTPPAVANQVIRCVDLSASAYAYTIEGVPPSTDEYLVLPFFDMNGNVDPTKPDSQGPDACDLISVGVAVTVTAAGETANAAEITVSNEEALLTGLGCAACAP